MASNTKTQTAAVRVSAEELLDAETEVVLAEWKQREEDDRRRRARGVASRRLLERRKAEAPEQPGYWAPRLARHGMAEVTAAPGWADCPVPANSASTVNFDGYPTDNPRPVAYCASVWTLDEQGIHLRTGGYWISSPVFQTQRGVNGAPDRFAVLVHGTWRIVDGPTIPTDGRGGQADGKQLFVETVQRLTAGGLVLNKQPLEVYGGGTPLSTIDNPNLVAVLHDNRHVEPLSAASQLHNFFGAHKTEAPIREGNRR